MKIDTSKIKGYADMSNEDKLKALEGFDLTIDYTGYIKKEDYDKAASEAADYKKKWKATLSEKEQLEIGEAEKRKEIEEKLQRLENEKTLSDYKSKFVALGYDEKNASETAQAMVNGDMDKVFANQQKFKDAQETAIKAELLKNTPTPPVGNGGDGKLSAERFKAMSLAEKQKLATEDPESYREFYKEA